MINLGFFQKIFFCESGPWFWGPICVIMPNAVHADRSNRCRDIVIFKLLGCRPPPCRISLDLKVVTDQTVTKAELRKRAEFCWNCGRDMAIFRFFKMAADAMWNFWNYKVLTVRPIISDELRHHDKFRGHWSNRCHEISILYFSRWRQPQAWIFKNLHFNDPNGKEGRTASLCQILWKSPKPRRL